MSRFAWADVIVSALALFALIYQFKAKLSVKQIVILVLGTLTIGVSFGLPFLGFCLSNKSTDLMHS